MSRDKKDKGPAVDKGGTPQASLNYVSVSQIQKAAGCLRQWAMPYALGFKKPPETKSQKIGKEGHARLEHFLKTGSDVLGPLERVALDRGLIPTPGPDLMVELEFTHLRAAGVPMLGYIDLVHRRTPGRIHVLDWKFKGDIKRYGSSAEDLTDTRTDAGIQMVAYAAAVSMLFPEPVVDLSHVEIQTKGARDARHVHTEIGVDTARAQWETVSARVVPRMQEAARAASFKDVDKDEKYCDKYGGCPYRRDCFDPLKNILAGFRRNVVPQTEEKKSMGLMGNLIGVGAVAPAQAPAAPAPAPAPAPAAPAAPPRRALTIADRTDTLKAGACKIGEAYLVDGKRLEFNGTSRDFAFFTANDGNPPVRVNVLTEVTIAPAEAPAAPIITPPDAPKSDPKLATVGPPAAPAPAPAPSVPQTAPQMTAALQASIAQAAPAPAAPAPAAQTAPVEEPKKRRGRPPGAKNKAPAAEGAAPAPESDADGIFLYFGCAPVGVFADSLLSYVRELDEKISKGAQIQPCNAPQPGETPIYDLRLSQGQEFGFGRYKVILAAASLEAPPPGGHYVVSAGDDRVEAVAAALCEIASLVVRG